MGERELRVPEDTSLRAAREVSGLRCPTVLVCKAVRVWCVWRAGEATEIHTQTAGRTRRIGDLTQFLHYGMLYIYVNGAPQDLTSGGSTVPSTVLYMIAQRDKPLAVGFAPCK